MVYHLCSFYNRLLHTLPSCDATAKRFIRDCLNRYDGWSTQILPGGWTTRVRCTKKSTAFGTSQHSIGNRR